MEEKYTVLVVQSDGQDIVQIMNDGSIKYLNDFSPDTACKVFWNAVGHIVQENVGRQVAQVVMDALLEVSDELKDLSDKAQKNGSVWEEMGLLQASVLVKEHARDLMIARANG